MKIYGYIRVSSADQNEDRQLLVMRELIPSENLLWTSSQARILSIRIIRS